MKKINNGGQSADALRVRLLSVDEKLRQLQCDLSKQKKQYLASHREDKNLEYMIDKLQDILDQALELLKKTTNHLDASRLSLASQQLDECEKLFVKYQNLALMFSRQFKTARKR